MGSWSKTWNKTECLIERRTQPEAETVLFLGSGFAQIFRQIVSHDESKDT